MKQNTRILCGAMAAAMTVSLAGGQGVRRAAAANPRAMTRRRLREPVYQR